MPWSWKLALPPIPRWAGTRGGSDRLLAIMTAAARRWTLLLGAVVASTTLGAATTAAQGSAADIARGKYVFGATGGCGCHTVKGQPVNADGRRYDGGYGTGYSTNITPDRETGIGSWTDEQIITAIRLGRRPNGERLLPVHPYTVFNGMTADDLKTLVTFLRTVPPVKRANQAKRITVPLFESVFLPAWLAAFAPRETPPATAPTGGAARGDTWCGPSRTAASATPRAR